MRLHKTAGYAAVYCIVSISETISVEYYVRCHSVNEVDEDFCPNMQMKGGNRRGFRALHVHAYKCKSSTLAAEPREWSLSKKSLPESAGTGMLAYASIISLRSI